METKNKDFTQPLRQHFVSGCAKPKREEYGWLDGGLYEDTGWMIEGGEEAYFEALKKWEDAQKNNG